MRDALEKISGKSVTASDAKHGYRYICPDCHQQVILREGNVRSPYFAHAPGVSDEDCALYAVAQSSAHGHAQSGAFSDADEAEMRLCLKLGRVNGIYSWGLELVVPTSGLTCGYLAIDVGGRISEIRLDGNTSAVRAVTAEPQAESYQIVEAQPKFGPLAFMQKTCLGLSNQRATVFGDISRPNANFVYLAQALRGDRTYAILWSDAIVPEFPAELPIEFMAVRSGWRGALLHIPHGLSDTCKNWLVEFTNLDFTGTTPGIVPVWPPLLRAVTSRCMKARPSDAITIFVESDEQGSTAITPPIFARSEKTERVAHADARSAPFYQLSSHDSKSVHLACRKTSGLELDIDFVLEDASIRERLLNAVVLNGTDKDGRQRNAMLHSQDAMPWILSVRSGAVQVTSITIPIGVRGVLKVGRNQEWTTTINLSAEHAVRSPPQTSLLLTTKIIQQISAIFRDDSLDVLMDFSGLGRALIFAQSNQVICQTATLPAPVLARIRTYFVQFPNASALGDKPRKNSERELVEAILRSRPTPQSLIVHRTLIADIKKARALT